MKDLGHLAPPATTTGHYFTLSFRPIIFVLGPTENTDTWELGLKCLSALACSLFDVAEEDLFSIACADHAAAGHLAVLTRYPSICWLQCWVHMLRKSNDQRSNMPTAWNNERKTAKVEWLRGEIKSMARCPLFIYLQCHLSEYSALVFQVLQPQPAHGSLGIHRR
jgi:hypothetical protein